MTDRILAMIDGAVQDYTSSDAMRWTPDVDSVAKDRRRPITRGQPAEVQASWGWWCSTCEQPIPQPRWIRRKGELVSYHETIDYRMHRIERRDV